MLKFDGQGPPDTLRSMTELFDAMQTTVAKYDGDVQDLSGMTVAGGVSEVVSDAVVSVNLVKALAGLRANIELAMAQNALPDRDDLLKLLEDPLTPETRATRRNVGALAALAFLLGVGGRSPESFLGVGMSKFPSFAFPLLVAVVLAYEFRAFSLYVAADIARREIHEERAARYLGALKSGAERFRALLPRLDVMVARAGTEPAGPPLKLLASKLCEGWEALASKFESDLKVQRTRRTWDVTVPRLLAVIGLLFLLSMTRVIWWP